MNKNERAKLELQKGIEVLVDRAFKSISKQFTTGIIVSNGTNQGYKVNVNKEEFDNILSLNGITLSSNNTVVVVYPNGQENNMFILGKLE